VILIYLAFYAVTAYTVVDIARAPRDLVRTRLKVLWIILVLLFGLLGTALWFLVGRPGSPARRRRIRLERRDHPAYGGQRDGIPSSRVDAPSSLFGRHRAATRPLGPDDDPEFLQELSERLRRGNPDGPTPRP
jgi:hypothetical protein